MQTKINIVATSGDTGAAARCISWQKNLNIFVLHPHNKISLFNEKL